MQEYKLSEAARMLDVHPDTLRYWEEKGLIPYPRRNPNNNYRVFNKEEIMEIRKLRGIKN